MLRCPRSDCKGTSFKVEEFEPNGSAFRLMAVACSTCGAVVGVMDYWNIGAQLKKLASRLNVSIE
jgi:hypothetical protein